jgi:hypothetical protein
MEAKTDVAHAIDEMLLVDTHEHLGFPLVPGDLDRPRDSSR